MHSCIDIELCDSTRMVESIANDSDCMAAILSAAVGYGLRPLPVLIWGRVGLKNRTIRRSTKQTKIICETQIILK